MQQAFPAVDLEWVMEHPWGDLHPHVTATNEDGSRSFICGPEFTTGQVRITFDEPTAGVLTLIGPSASLIDDLAGEAVVLGPTPPVEGLVAPAVIEPGRGAAVS